MSVTSVQLADKERFVNQIERLVHSNTLRKAESLCRLLRYLADHALAQPGVPLKEYQIATEVFGRSESFDPQTDSAIRVQAGRLRLKLLDYYSHEGFNDPVVVEVPNGSYTLSFHDRTSATPLAIPAPSNAHPVQAPAAPKLSRWARIAVLTLSVLLLLTLVALAGLYAELVSAKSRTQAAALAPESLRTFWGQFGAGPEAPWVIFSNGAFVGRPETGMRYLDPSRDSGQLILDHYTGVGEVLAVHELDHVFSQLNQPVRVKRGSLFSLDDARNNDLIFVGSPAENLTLLDLPGSQEFVFRRVDSIPHKGDLGIVNVHPEAGQPSIYYPTDSNHPLVEDYAVIALLQGLEPGHQILILAGTTTIGTQAAVEYVCQKDSIEELLRSLGVKVGSEVKPFEALLRVKVARGVPVSTQLLAVRPRG